MIIQIASGFFKKIPPNILPRIKQKIQLFIETLAQDTATFLNLTKGYFCKKIKGTKNYYKFKTNRGDRIVFKYLEDIGIMLIRYCCHDEQIRFARNRTKQDDIPIEIEKTEYVEDDFDKKIDDEFLKDIKEKLLSNDLISAKELYVQESSVKFSKRIKEIDCAISLQQFYEDYKKYAHGKSGVVLQADSGRFMLSDFQYAFRRLNNDKGLILAPYCFVHVTFAPTINQPFYFEESKKCTSIAKYIDGFASAIYNYFGSIEGGRNFIIEGCFYDKNKKLVQESLNYVVDVKKHTLEESNVSMIYFEDDDNQMRNKNTFIEFLSWHLGQKSIMQKNIQFLGI